MCQRKPLCAEPAASHACRAPLHKTGCRLFLLCIYTFKHNLSSYHHHHHRNQANASCILMSHEFLIFHLHKSFLLLLLRLSWPPSSYSLNLCSLLDVHHAIPPFLANCDARECVSLMTRKRKSLHSRSLGGYWIINACFCVLFNGRYLTNFDWQTAKHLIWVMAFRCLRIGGQKVRVSQWLMSA